MKALTVWQPWASLIILGYKLYETRSWMTNIRGKIAIHAAKYHKIPHEIYLQIAEAIGIDPEKYNGSWLYYLEHGIPAEQFEAILGTTEITDCGEIDSIQEFNCAPWETGYWNNRINWRDVSQKEIALGDWTPGRFAWQLNNPHEFTVPIPAKGSQGFWNWENKEDVTK